MCEKRTRKIKKGSHMIRMREARRLQRLQRLTSPPSNVENNRVPCPPPKAEKPAQNRVIFELALKTIALMHKNKLIQQKIIELKKETSEFVATIMKNPESKQRYLENVRVFGILKNQISNTENNAPLKIDPKV